MRLQTVLAWMALVLLAVGCTQQKPAADADAAMDVPDWLSSDSSESESDKLTSRNKEIDDADLNDVGEEEPTARTLSGEQPLSEPEELRRKLKLQLQPGEQFPLRKQVMTTLLQTARDGTQQKIVTDLRLLLTIQVEEVSAGRTRLNVRYNRVEFKQNMDGQEFAYRSDNPPTEIPVAARAYHDMINDGFSFWIDKDNQINEVVGFREFIQRCLVNIPPAQQKQVLMGMEARSDENGISDFVDHTIGLLPFGKDVTPGQEWNRQHNIGHPIPMVVDSVYTLQDLTESEAVVRITGKIIPSETINKVSHTQDGIQVHVLGGLTTGKCVISRETGLPKESYTERVVNMTVDLSDGQSFEQTKTVQTRVEAFPAERQP